MAVENDFAKVLFQPRWSGRLCSANCSAEAAKAFDETLLGVNAELSVKDVFRTEFPYSVQKLVFAPSLRGLTMKEGKYPDSRKTDSECSLLNRVRKREIFTGATIRQA